MFCQNSTLQNKKKNEQRKRKLSFVCLLLVIMLPVFGQQHTVTGIITDINGETVIGASIQEKGTTNGTITNVDGQFTLLVQPDAVLVVSYIGYRTQEIAAVFDRTIHITLEEATETLEEVVVVGYGVQKKATLSGSVTSVRGDDIVNAPVMNVSNSLAGRMPGVVAISKNSEPG